MFLSDFRFDFNFNINLLRIGTRFYKEALFSGKLKFVTLAL